jgi:hypothetical protein
MKQQHDTGQDVRFVPGGDNEFQGHSRNSSNEPELSNGNYFPFRCADLARNTFENAPLKRVRQRRLGEFWPDNPQPPWTRDLAQTGHEEVLAHCVASGGPPGDHCDVQMPGSEFVQHSTQAVGEKFEVDSREAFLERLPEARKSIQTRLADETNAERAVAKGFLLASEGESFVAQPENLSRVSVKPLPGWREASSPAARTVEKRNTDSVFEFANPDTDRGLRAEHAFRNAQKTVFFGNRNEHFELHEFHSGLSCFGSP